MRNYILLIFLSLSLAACGPATVGDSASDALKEQSSNRTPASENFQIPAPRPSSAGNLSVCKDPNVTMGIDVSPWNPNINWSRVKIAGKNFAFIKATEGNNYISPTYAGDWAATKANGIVRGAYHFFRPGQDPVQQAQLFLQNIGTQEADDMPAMFDWEVTDGVSPSVQIQRALTWLTLVENATGKTPVIYTGPSFWNSLGNPTAFNKYPLFIANYQINCPLVPAPWSKWTFWQYGTFAVDGVPSAVTDSNYFNGTLDDLKAFARRRSM